MVILSPIPAVTKVDEVLLLLAMLLWLLQLPAASFFLSSRFEMSNSIPSNSNEFLRPVFNGPDEVVVDVVVVVVAFASFVP